MTEEDLQGMAPGREEVWVAVENLPGMPPGEVFGVVLEGAPSLQVEE